MCKVGGLLVARTIYRPPWERHQRRRPPLCPGAVRAAPSGCICALRMLGGEHLAAAAGSERSAPREACLRGAQRLGQASQAKLREVGVLGGSYKMLNQGGRKSRAPIQKTPCSSV